MTISDSHLLAAVEADTPPILWGDPGIGKTARIYALASKHNWHLEVVLASVRDPQDFSGLPYITDGGVALSPPAWAVRLKQAHERGQRAVLFLDEISCAAPAVQAALLRVVNERVVGDLAIPGVRVIGAANPPETGAAAWDLPAASANRWVHLHVTPDLTAWVDGMRNGWGQEQTESVALARALIASFVRRRPELLINVPKDPRQQGRGWPSPRTWDRTGLLLGHFATALRVRAERAIRTDDALPLVAGLVGDAAATQLLAWARELDLPDPEQVLRDPKGAAVPTRGDTLAAALDAVALAVPNAQKQALVSRMNAAWVYFARASANRLDIALPAAGLLARISQKHMINTVPPEGMALHRELHAAREELEKR